MKILDLTVNERKDEAKIVIDLHDEPKESYLLFGEKGELENITDKGFDGLNQYLIEREIFDFIEQENDRKKIAEFVEEKARDKNYLNAMKEIGLIDYKTIYETEELYSMDDYYLGSQDVESELVIAINYSYADFVYSIANDEDGVFTSDNLSNLEESNEDESKEMQIN